MPKRGPKPKPKTKLKLIEGDRSKGKIYTPVSHKRPTAECKPPRMPADMPDKAKTFWKRIVPELVKLGTVSEADGEAVRALAISWYHWQNLEDIIEEIGYLTTDNNGNEKIHPAVEAARRAEQRFTQLAAHFGMTPLSRCKIELPPSAEAEPAPGQPRPHGVSEDMLDA